jgi:hypothetical protein
MVRYKDRMHSTPVSGWMINSQSDYELMYNDISKAFLARIEELSNHILDLERILYDNDLPIPNDHIEL